MEGKNNRFKIFRTRARCGVAVLSTILLLPGDAVLATCSQEQQSSRPTEPETTRIPADQLDSLVAPIALYPDQMLAQVLAASTYPLEIIQLQQWLTKNKDLKDKALADAVAKQPWDPSVQALAGLPDVVKRLADDIQWTTDLGNAFLAQQNDVMDAVQRMRAKAKDKGNLNSNEQQKVETKVVESKQVIVIEQSNPQVVYVPSYNPTVVYGPPAYPYPPVAYPPPGYYAAGMAISFGVGVAMGAMWSGGWGYNCGWGGNNNVTINNNNNFNRNSNIQGGNRVSNQPARGGTGGGNWQHNPNHRGGAPYSNRQTANKYGGTTRGSSVADRQANARQNLSNRGQGNRGGVGDNRGGVGDNRGDRGGVGDNRGDRGGNRGGGAGDRGGNRGGGDRVGNRSTSGSGGSRGMSGGGMNGSSARASSSRGASSMGSRGGSRGGGGGRRR
jgi:hypothetical protein